METFIQLLAIIIFAGVTIAHYRKPRGDTKSLEHARKKIPPFSHMINNVIYDPRRATLLAYYFATFGQKFNGDSPVYGPDPFTPLCEHKQMMEKAAFNLNDEFFILYWWRGTPDNPELYIFNNKQDFLDEIYNHWGVELHSQLNEYLGCDEKQEATATA